MTARGSRRDAFVWASLVAIFAVAIVGERVTPGSQFPAGVSLLAAFVSAAFFDARRVALVASVALAVTVLFFVTSDLYHGTALVTRAINVTLLAATSVVLALIRDRNERSLVLAERNAAETQRASSMAALRSAVFEALQDGFCVVADDGTIRDLNDGFAHIFGRSREEVLACGPPYPWWPDPARHPEARAAFDEGRAQLASGARTEVVVHCQHRDGRLFPVAMTASLLRDERGRVMGYVGTARDITRRLRGERRAAVTARVMQAVTPTRDRADLGDVLAGELIDLFHADFSSVRLLEGARLELIGSRGATAAALHEWVAMPAKEPMPAPHAVAERTAVVCNTHEEIERRFPKVADRYRDAGMASFVYVPINNTRGPVGVLAVCARRPRAFGADEIALLEEVATLVAPVFDRACLFEFQRDTATALQAAMLSSTPTSLETVEVATRYRPSVDAYNVGGDWYDVTPTSSGRIGIAVGDVVGRALDAAVTMGRLRSALAGAALHSDGPARVLDRLDAFARTIPEATATTCVYAVIDVEGQWVEYATAGHLPPVVVSPDGSVRADTSAHGLPLAVGAPGRRRSEVRLPFPPGSTLVLYTDGVVERRGESIDDGLARLCEHLAKLASRPVERLADELVDAALRGSEQIDDAALVVVRVPTPASTTFTRRAPGVMAQLGWMRHQLDAWLRRHGVDSAVRNDAVVAVGEALTNVVEHAYGGGDEHRAVLLEAEYDECRLEIRVCDEGRWRPRTVEHQRGRGLKIIEAAMDDVEIIRAPQGSQVVMRRRVEVPAVPSAR